MKSFLSTGIYVFLMISCILFPHIVFSQDLNDFLHHRIVGIYSLMDDNDEQIRTEETYGSGYRDGLLNGKLSAYKDVLINFQDSN